MTRPENSLPPAPTSGEFLTFRLGAEEYGIDIQKVQEIRSCEAPTRIANAPPFVKGVVNLRGAIVPIVDLRLALGRGSAEIDSFTVAIVLTLRGRAVGVAVDAVSDVLALSHEAIEAAPEMASAVDARFITGIGSVGERTLILIDIEALLASPNMGFVEAGK